MPDPGATPSTPARVGAPARAARRTGEVLRAPRPRDAASIWRLAESERQLDANSPYAYLLLCDHFADTGVVAEDEDGETLGFVLGYRVPERPDTVFVWQVGVAPAARGRGLGGRLLLALLARPGCRGVRALEATVTPGNAPSRALFAGLAQRLGSALQESQGYAAGLFPVAHEEERRVRIEKPSTRDGGVRGEES